MKYILYDAMARLEGTDEATILTVSDTLEEARDDRDSLFPKESPIFSYDEDNGELINERLVE